MTIITSRTLTKLNFCMNNIKPKPKFTKDFFKKPVIIGLALVIMLLAVLNFSSIYYFVYISIYHAIGSYSQKPLVCTGTNRNVKIDDCTVITKENIGSGECYPSTIRLNQSIACVFDLVNGFNYTKVDGRNGASYAGGVVVYSEYENGDFKESNMPDNFYQFTGDCDIIYNNKLICTNVIAGGNLTTGVRYVDVLFKNSTPRGYGGISSKKAKVIIK